MSGADAVPRAPGPRRGALVVDGLIMALLGGAALALYVTTLAPTVLAGDGGEFQFVPYLLGVAHPTGYPLYSLLGWAWSRLVPIGDVAYRLNLFSAVWAALAVALLYPAARAFLAQAVPALAPVANRAVAAGAAATLAVTPTFWSQAVIAEVYTLHILFLVVLLNLLLVWATRRDSRLLLAAALTFGLGLAHHRTMVALAPACLVFVWLTDRRALANRALVGKALLLLLLPLLLYLYIPWRAPHTPYLHLPLTEDPGGRELVLYDNTAAGLVDFVLGGPFGGSLDLTVDLRERLAMAGGLHFQELGWLGLGLALVGAVWLAVKRQWALLSLTGLAYAAVVAFNLVYTIGDIYVLFVPAYLILVLWLAAGAGALVQLVRRPVLAATLGCLLLVLPASMVGTHLAAVDQSDNAAARRRWQAILSEPLPAGAILVSNDRNEIMPMWYYQYVDGVRPDLLGLFPLITPDYATLGPILDLALGTGRPVYLIKEMPGVEVKVETEPAGSLWRVVGPAVTEEAAVPRARPDRLGDAVALTGYDRTPHSPRPGEPLQVSLYWEALHPLPELYHSFVHLVDGSGRVIAASDHQPGGAYYPTTLWRPGEPVRDEHRLAIPADTPVGVYRLLAGLYALAADGGLQPLGEPVAVGPVAVKTGSPTEPGAIGRPVEATFGDQIELLGYDPQLAGDSLTVRLHWRAQQPPAGDYTVFVHLVDGDGQIVAQHDAPPLNGGYPTSVWDTGEVVVDEHLVSLPPGLAPGEYRLRVGLYRPETGERLPFRGGADAIELGPIEVAGPP